MYYPRFVKVEHTINRKGKAMADKKEKGNGASVNRQSMIPDSAQLVTPIEGDGQRWWRKEAASVVYGRLLGRFARNDGESFYYQIRIGEYKVLQDLLKRKSVVPYPNAVMGRGDDTKTMTVKPGDVINVDEIKAIQNLAGYVESDGIFDAIVHALEKTKIAGGHTYWRMESGAIVVKPASGPVRQPRTAGDSLPF